MPFDAMRMLELCGKTAKNGSRLLNNCPLRIIQDNTALPRPIHDRFYDSHSDARYRRPNDDVALESFFR